MQYSLILLKEVSLNYLTNVKTIWTASSEFGTYRLSEQRRFRRACASAQSRQNLRCSLIQAVSQEEPSNRKPDLWPLWMAGHAQLKCVMTECSKTQTKPYLSMYQTSKYRKFNTQSTRQQDQHWNAQPTESQTLTFGRPNWRRSIRLEPTRCLLFKMESSLNLKYNPLPCNFKRGKRRCLTIKPAICRNTFMLTN